MLNQRKCRGEMKMEQPDKLVDIKDCPEYLKSFENTCKESAKLVQQTKEDDEC
jgi:hypothetical protein